MEVGLLLSPLPRLIANSRKNNCRITIPYVLQSIIYEADDQALLTGESGG